MKDIVSTEKGDLVSNEQQLLTLETLKSIDERMRRVEVDTDSTVDESDSMDRPTRQMNRTSEPMGR